MRPSTALLALALLSPLPAIAAPPPTVAVLWLDAPPGVAGPSLVAPPADAVTLVDRALAGSQAVRPLDDAERKRTLAEGGPATRVRRHVAAAQAALVAGKFAQADGELAAAEDDALRELPVAPLRPALAEIETLRMVVAAARGDEAAGQRAAELRRMTAIPPTADDAASLARWPEPYGPSPAAATVRIESEPAGADVYVDLQPIGKTPLDLPPLRRADALVDLELAGYHKVHRVAPSGGTLAIGLQRDDGIAALVDNLRAAHAAGTDLAAADVAELGRRVAAQRVLVLRMTVDLAGAPAIQARALDVAQARWDKPAVTIPTGDKDAGAHVASYAAPPVAVAAAPAVASAPKAKGTVKTAASTEKNSSKGGWRKWYTWVIGGALVAVVLGFVIADHIGSDQLTVQVTH